MVEFKVRLKRLKPPEVLQSYFNAWVREGLLLAGEWWIKNALPRHFGRGATQRYKYALRKAKYMIQKARRFEDLRSLVKTAAAGGLNQDPRPFESGITRNRRYPKTIDTVRNARVRAFATSAKQHAEITVPLGHPIHPDHAGEMSKVLKEEIQTMRRIVIDHVKRRRREFQLLTGEVTLAAAA